MPRCEGLADSPCPLGENAVNIQAFRQGDMTLCDHCNHERHNQNDESTPAEPPSPLSPTAPAQSQEDPETAGETGPRAIIVSELLCFICNKINTVPRDTLRELSIEFYSNPDIEMAKKILFDAMNKRYNVRKGSQRKISHFYDIYDFLIVTEPDSLPLFVALDLNNIPQLTGANPDTASLMRNLNNLSSQFTIMSTDLTSQITSLSSELSAVNGRFNSLRHEWDNWYDWDQGRSDNLLTISDNLPGTNSGDPNNTPSYEPHETLESLPIVTNDESLRPIPTDASFNLREQSAANSGDPNNRLNEPLEYQTVPGEYSFAKAVSSSIPTHISAPTQRPPSRKLQNQPTSTRPRPRTKPTIGTLPRQRSNLTVISRNPTRDIFITRLGPETRDSDIVRHVKTLVGCQAVVEKLDTKYDSYSSFCITVSADFSDVLLGPHIWPEGILVKPFRRRRSDTNRQ